MRLGKALLALIAGAIVLGPGAARAACHIADFTDSSISASEGAGQVTLTVELVGGQPTCEGTVDYQTQNGSATAPQDYTARSGTLTFQAGDDRRESISIPIVDDSSDEPNQSFQVHLHNPTGSISATGSPATVTINDNDDPPQTAPATSTPAPSPRRTTARRTTTPTPTRTASPASATPNLGATAPPGLSTPSPTDTTTTHHAAPAASGGDSKTGPAIALVAGVLVLIAIGALLFRRLRA